MKTHFYTDKIIEICDNHHLTVDEIFEQIQIFFPEAGKSSIYRNVEDLAKQWILKKVEWIGKKSYFEKTKNEHIHLIDTVSGKIIDLDINASELFHLPKNFHLQGSDIKLFWTFA